MQVVLDILKAFFTIIKWPLAAVAAVLVLLGLCCAVYGFMAYRKGARLKKGEHIHVPKVPFWKNFFYYLPKQMVTDYFARDPEFFRYQGCIVFTGRQGYGKTIAMAEQALRWNARGLYAQQALSLRAMAVLARCARGSENVEARIAEYREEYLRAPEAVRYHLLLARYQLEQEHIQAAEREIWSIAELPERNKAEYLVLRGRIAAKKEQFENARLYLQQAEALAPLPQILLRELFRAMELCCKEIEDYQGAYQYAAKQLALPPMEFERSK